MEIITKSTSERNKEIQELFEQMKPYLLEGKSYNQALMIVKGNRTSYSHTRWYKDLVQYGESQGYPKNNFEYISRYGVDKLQLSKNKNSPTGYYWTYVYYNKMGKRRSLSHSDLNKLQDHVKSKELPWIVFNQYKLDKAFQLNEDLQKNKKPYESSIRGRKTKSGVKYVSKTRNKQALKGYYWIYKEYNKKRCIQACSLKELERKIKKLEYPWIIIDKDKYNENLFKEENEKNL